MALVPIKPSQVSLAYNSGADVDIDNDVLVVGSNASSGQVAKLSPAQLRDAIIPVAGQRYWNVDPGPGFGDEYSYTDDAVLTAAQDGAAINNAGAAKAIEITLPAAVAGREFSVQRIENFSVIVKAASPDMMNGAVVAGSFVMNNRGIAVFACNFDGYWEVVLGGDNSGVLNVRSYGAIGDGVSPDSEAIQKCIDDAYDAHKSVYFPWGVYLVDTTLTYKAPMIGAGYGSSTTAAPVWLIPGMTDGTPILDAALLGTFQIENINFGSRGSVVNCVGVNLGTLGAVDIAGTAATRGIMRNVVIRACASGLQVKGWLNSFQNVHLLNCTNAFEGEQLNTCDFDLVIEGCTGREISIVNSLVVLFRRLECEGTTASVTSTIDSSRDIVFSTVSFEQTNRAVPWFTVGSSGPNRVFNITINGGLVSCPSTAGVSAFAFDYVDGYDINVRLSSPGSPRRGISTTTNTRNRSTRPPRHDFGLPFTTVASAFVLPVHNVFPNPYMDGRRFGVSNTAVTNVTISEDTSTYRTGNSGLKVLGTAASTSNILQFVINDPVVASFSSRQVTVAGWVWIPDKSTMNAEPTPSITPKLAVQSYAGSYDSPSYSAGYGLKAGWNFMHVVKTFQAASTQMIISMYLNPLGGTIAANPDEEYVVIDSLFCCLGDCWEDIYAGRVIQSPLSTGRIEGGVLVCRTTIAKVTAIEADADQYFEVGDTLMYSDPAGAAVIGRLCTVAGAGGTATFVNIVGT